MLPYKRKKINQLFPIVQFYKITLYNMVLALEFVDKNSMVRPFKQKLSIQSILCCCTSDLIRLHKMVLACESVNIVLMCGAKNSPDSTSNS